MIKAIEYFDKAPMLYWTTPARASATQMAKKDKSIDSDDYILTKKRDGLLYRALVTEDGVILQSRTVSKKTGNYVEKQENVPHICNSLVERFPVNTVLMGEVCYPESAGTDSISSDIVKIMGALPTKAIKRQEDQKLVFYIFDVLLYNGEDYASKSYKERISLLEKLSTNDIEYVEFVKPIYSNKREQIATWLEEGWEGGMLMHKDKPYVFDVKGKNKRPSWTSIKIKQEVLQDMDLVIIGKTAPIKEYTGRNLELHPFWEDKEGSLIKQIGGAEGLIPVTKFYFNNLIGSLVLAAYDKDNELVEVARVSNLTDELRQTLTDNFEKYFLMSVTVGAMSIDLEKKSLRHPRLLKLRPDKPASDCKWENIFG